MNPSITKEVSNVMNALWDQGDKHKLKPIFDFAHDLPPSLVFKFYTYKLQGGERTRRLRTEFNNSNNKREVFRFFGQNYGTELFQMGVSNSQIDRMAEDGIKPKFHDGRPLDMTVDHIKSLGLGGGNLHRNLCLLPGIYNHFKDVLENLQFNGQRGEQFSGRIITMVPASESGRMNRVPYFEDGFKPRINNAGLIRN